ncbi:MAG: riboflavin synthase [Alphaproteobacteria bacterium]
MFTGIVTDLGAVRSVEKRGDSRFLVATGYDMEGVAIGASIACSGACLTVVDKGPDWFATDVSAETLARTTLGDWGPGTRVNLERPLRAGDELGGHIVLGHVDGVGKIAGREPVGDSVRLEIAAPDSLARFIAEKGSIAVDGIALTVNRVAGARFEVNVIPHTLACTTLGAAALGARVNLEVDVLARYVARLNERGEP